VVRVPKERPRLRLVVEDFLELGYSLREVEDMDLYGRIHLQAKRMRLLGEGS